MKKINTYFELEAGSLTIRNDNGQLEFLTIFRNKMNDYTLPKGHVEEGESLEDAAKRESLEETGYEIKIDDFIDSFEYKVKEEKYGQESNIIRRVYYFIGEVIGGKLNKNNPDRNEGKIIATWLSYDDALSKLTYESDKDLVKKIFNRKTIK